MESRNVWTAGPNALKSGAITWKYKTVNYRHVVSFYTYFVSVCYVHRHMTVDYFVYERTCYLIAAKVSLPRVNRL